jgi:hypothetical protein
LVLFQGYERRWHCQQKIGCRLKFSGDITTRCFPGSVDEMAKAIAVKGKVKKEEKTLTFEYKKEGEKMIATMIKVAAPKAVPKKEKPAEAPKK